MRECLYSLFCVNEIKRITVTFRSLKMTSCSRTCMEQLANYLFLYYKANEEQQQLQQLLGSQQLVTQSPQPPLPPPAPQHQQQQRKRRRDGGGSEEQGKSEVERNDEMLRERIRLMIADVEL